MTKKETKVTKVVETAVPVSGTSSTEKSSSKKSTVKVDLKKDLPGKVSLFKTIEVDTTKKMSLKS